MKIEQWEKAKKHLTRPGRKILEDKAKKELMLPKETKMSGSKLLNWINYNNKITGANNMPITKEEKRVAEDIEKAMYVSKSKQYTKEFKSEDPSTYLSNEEQQQNMLLDTVDAKLKDKKDYYKRNPEMIPLSKQEDRPFKKDKKEKWTYTSWADGLEERTRPVKKELIKIVKKPTPIKPIKPLDPLDDWRLAPWWLYPEDDDVKPEEDKTRIKKKIKTGIAKLI